MSSLDLVSARPDGRPATGVFGAPAISADGRFVAFTSDDPNLVAGDTNGEDDVFVRDLQTGELILVSVSLDGVTPGDFWSRGAILSADGRFVAFSSGASNLVDIPNPQSADAYVRDLVLGETYLVSINGAGNRAAQGFSGPIDITPDGRYVLFSSNAQDLGFTDFGIDSDVFVRDLLTDQTLPVNLAGSGDVLGNGDSFANSISDDGRYVVFSSRASDLVAGDDNQSTDVFLRDLVLEQTLLVSRNVDGTGTGNQSSFTGVIAPDGRSVVFSSNATDLLLEDDDFLSDLYRFEVGSGEITLVTRDTTTRGCANDDVGHFFLVGGGFVSAQSISEDGRWVLSINQIDSPQVPTADIPHQLCVFDTEAGRAIHVNRTRRDEVPTAGRSNGAAISADGRFVVFDAEAYLAEGAPAVDGAQPRRNLYLRDLVSGELTLLSWNRQGDDTPNGVSEFPAIDSDGDRVVFASTATDLVAGPMAEASRSAYLLSRTGRWAPPRPADAAIVDSQREFSYTTRISTFEPMEPQAPVRLGTPPPSCLPDTVCASGALPDRPEVLMRTVGPRGNGFFWPTMVKFTTSTIEVWVEQLANGEQRYYRLDGAQPGVDELPGLFDRMGFAPPVEPAISAPVARSHSGGHPEDPPSDFFTSPLYPGFEFRVRITNQQGEVQDVRRDDVCLDETVCFSGALPGRPEVFVRIVGPRPNGFLWPTLVKLTTSQVEVWIDRPSTGESQYYLLEGAAPGFDVLPGLFDRTGFTP